MNDEIENKAGYSKNDFLSFPFWGTSGYIESFHGYENDFEESFVKLLSKFYNNNKTCLDIGCGGGFWSKKYLTPNFSKVIGLDLLPTSEIEILKNEAPKNFEYIEVTDRDYLCTGVADSSVDFVFSFGVFCHLPNSAISTYVDSIYKKLKPGGEALIMFADFFKRKKYAPFDLVDDKFGHIDKILTNYDLQDQCRETNTFWGWFWMDHETLYNILNDSNFSSYQDVSPKRCRDAIIHLRK